jgi:hypothetical protein
LTSLVVACLKPIESGSRVPTEVEHIGGAYKYGGSMSQPWQREEGVLRGRRLLPVKTYVYISICIKCMTCRAQWVV